jgi:polyketide synthase 5
VRGVLHAAAVVEDATLTNITDELLEYDWAPKVDGAWNLHRALQETTADQPLDWFCSFSAAARWARPGRAPTPRPTAGWTPSPAGDGLRAARPVWSRLAWASSRATSASSGAICSAVSPINALGTQRDST